MSDKSPFVSFGDAYISKNLIKNSKVIHVYYRSFDAKCIIELYDGYEITKLSSVYASSGSYCRNMLRQMMKELNS